MTSRQWKQMENKSSETIGAVDIGRLRIGKASYFTEV